MLAGGALLEVEPSVADLVEELDVHRRRHLREVGEIRHRLSLDGRDQLAILLDVEVEARRGSLRHAPLLIGAERNEQRVRQPESRVGLSAISNSGKGAIVGDAARGDEETNLLSDGDAPSLFPFDEEGA